MSQEFQPVSRAADPSVASADDQQYRELDLAKYIRLLWSRRYLIFGCALLGAVLAYALAFSMHPMYDADVRLMPPDHTESLVGGLSLARNSGDLYLGLISSRTVADDVIEHQHLADYFHSKVPTVLRKSLAGMVKISVDKDQFVTVTVRAREPETAVRIANEFPAALYRLNHEVALSKAHHRLEYYEGPLEEETQKLADSENQLKEAQQKTGMVMPQAQVQLGLTAIAALKAEITTLDGQLAAARTGRTDQDPEVVRLKTEIGSLSGQLGRLEAQNGGSGRPVSSAELPTLTLEIDRKQREVKFHETLVEILSRQYENARVDESYSPPIELVDHAVMPDEKSYPPRRLFAEAGFAIGAVLSIAFILLRAAHALSKLREFLTEPPSSTGNSRA